jgi:hypothetical protein
MCLMYSLKLSIFFVPVFLTVLMLTGFNLNALLIIPFRAFSCLAFVGLSLFSCSVFVMGHESVEEAR